ncbi:MAG: PH domain-containing protein [Actinomycetota bacterium]|jgi:uncharacterized membrane protein YdbT with pleckstrin-like domain
MPFPEKNLNEGESVVIDMHPHWICFAEAAFALVGAIIFGIFVASRDSNGGLHKALSYLSIALLVGTAAWVVARYVKWATTHFVLTTQRVIFRSGAIAKVGAEIPIGRVNNVNFHQGVLERMLGAGDLLIESGGEDGQTRFTDIRHPDKVQLAIHSQLQSYNDGQRGGGGAAWQPPTASVDVADQLERLEAMMQRGSLTAEEFELQKRKLLGH